MYWRQAVHIAVLYSFSGKPVIVCGLQHSRHTTFHLADTKDLRTQSHLSYVHSIFVSQSVYDTNLHAVFESLIAGLLRLIDYY
jgi:hypothetical protein